MRLKQGYDYVIIGAGSAGCVMANQLSADPTCSVLLLEAGGWDRDPWIRIPIGWGRIMKKRLHDWGFNTEPEQWLGGRQLECTRGKVIGGSSSINAMAYVRGHRGDYERWAQAGLKALSYERALPVFKRQESWEGGEDAYRGADGPLGTITSGYPDPLSNACVEAGMLAGHPRTVDYNGEQQEGFGRLQLTIRNGHRCSAADAYLHPVLRRPNLDIATGTLVGGIEFEGDRAVAVQCDTGKGPGLIAASEIILSAGAINSPQILMLSGIGDPQELSKVGIRPRVALNGVGKNLQDHVTVAVEFERAGRGPFVEHMRADRALKGLAETYLLGRGFASELPSGWTAFLRTELAGALPDIQLIFRAVPMTAGPWFPPFRRPFADGFAIRAVLLRPQSQGSVSLTSSEPTAPVHIRQNLLSAAHDRTVMRSALRLIRDFTARSPLRPFIERVIAPDSSDWGDAALDEHMKSFAATAHHLLGTCRMGPEDDADAVVDPQFRVRGTRGLRVVDASVMPDMIGGNINAPVMMVAELAAQMINGPQADDRQAARPGG